MSLKVAQIPAFEPAERPYRKFDGRGLYIEIRPNGSKLWYFKYRFLGSEKRLALGAFPDVRLAEAREKCDDARRMIRAGEDPSHKRRMAKIKARLSAGNSFQSVAEDFIAVRFVASGKAEATIDKARWYLSHLTQAIGHRPIDAIEPAEVLVALKRSNAPANSKPRSGRGHLRAGCFATAWRWPCVRMIRQRCSGGLWRHRR